MRDRQAEALCLALPLLHDLRGRLQSIQDLLVARRVLGQLIADS